MASEQEKILSEVTGNDYKYGFQTKIETDTIPKGLSEKVVRIISAKKEEIMNKVPDFVFLNRERFHFCPKCKKVFWPGTHREGMKKKILSIIQKD